MSAWRKSPHGDEPGQDPGEALAALYAAYGRSLTRLASLLVGDPGAAADVVQAAFASVHASAQRFSDSDHVLSWLRRAVIRRARAWPRGRPGVHGPAAGRAGPVRALSAPKEALLMRALARLPVLQREAVVLRYYADLPDAEIASAMGVSARSAASLAGRGIARLGAMRGDSGGGEHRAGW